LKYKEARPQYTHIKTMASNLGRPACIIIILELLHLVRSSVNSIPRNYHASYVEVHGPWLQSTSQKYHWCLFLWSRSPTLNTHSEVTSNAMQRQVHKNVATCRTTNTGLRCHGVSLASCVNAAGSFNKCSWQLHSFGPIIGAVSIGLCNSCHCFCSTSMASSSVVWKWFQPQFNTCQSCRGRIGIEFWNHGGLINKRERWCSESVKKLFYGYLVRWHETSI